MPAPPPPLRCSQDLRQRPYIMDSDFQLLTKLLITLYIVCSQRSQSRRVWHGQYTRWPDYGVPGGGSAQPVLRFLALVRRAQHLALQE